MADWRDIPDAADKQEAFEKWADVLSERWVAGDRDEVLKEISKCSTFEAAYVAINIYYDLIQQNTDDPKRMLNETRYFAFEMKVRALL